MQDLNDMLLFADVIEHGGFAAAGRAAQLPKSRLSRRVARLEAQLGVQLLQRSSRKLSLTAAGESFLKHCIEMRVAAQAAFETVAQAQKEPHGTVRLSCPVTLAQGGVAGLIPRFLMQYPQVRVEMRVLNRPVDPVEDGVDLALRVRHVIEDSATLVAKTFGHSRGVLVAAPALLARQGGPVNGPGDLARLDTVAMNTSDRRGGWSFQGPDGSHYMHTHEPRYVADDLLVLVEAAVLGVGAAMLPDFMCRGHLVAGRLVQLLPEWTPPPRIVHAVFPARRALVPAVRHLLDFLAEHLVDDGLLVETRSP
ncbi:LysR family transcriptional regulator [Hydrogenophaga crassostreae]|uniref:LysR family transcriptional regulator n=1 Tax=Hydrogenophaga crassostreae TaxID=1763535 RepID=A0A167GRC0_9BURK|nr:LysR substrate-binding domain-containing protein [Hydrogenophaga crassostreae]AOW11706.1 LysR family transcriptional regulator [Hydrogenophaga crassostreae]OAD39798.1 LysR family transcriptional regulator [Hydrogenophaga crassostreae]